MVRAINDEPDYTKTGNYWRWLKRKLKLDGVQFVSGTHELKIVAADGKQYNNDALSAEDIILLAKHYLNNRASKFLDWLLTAITPLTGRAARWRTHCLKVACSIHLNRAV